MYLLRNSLNQNNGIFVHNLCPIKQNLHGYVFLNIPEWLCFRLPWSPGKICIPVRRDHLRILSKKFHMDSFKILGISAIPGCAMLLSLSNDAEFPRFGFYFGRLAVIYINCTFFECAFIINCFFIRILVQKNSESNSGEHTVKKWIFCEILIILNVSTF